MLYNSFSTKFIIKIDLNTAVNLRNFVVQNYALKKIQIQFIN